MDGVKREEVDTWAVVLFLYYCFLIVFYRQSHNVPLFGLLFERGE